MPHIAEMKYRRDKDSSHWYTVKGESAHDCDLRDARREKLLPSVTSVLGVLAKPGLERWKREQCIGSALKLERKQNECEEDFITRILVDAEKVTKKAADFGTDVHAACESINLGGPVTDIPALKPFIDHYWQWTLSDITEVISSEAVFVNAEAGYAGRCDLHAMTRHGEAIIDIKTQSIKPGKKPTFYDTWGMQLAAYAKCRSVKLGISVVINSEKPEPVYVNLWENLEPYYEAFNHCLQLWSFDRDYFPAKQLTQKN